MAIIGGCVPTPPTVSAPTPLEIQAIQKRDFETTKKIAFGSVISVLQDLGYIIDNADFETGIITGNSPTTSANSGAEVFLSVLSGSGYTQKATKTKVSAFVEEIRKNNISIRLNFVISNTSSTVYGQNAGEDHAILDKEIYIKAYNKIENAIFIRS